jgi:uncharacterized protein YqgV (UPF0045/DUF77 family)
MNKRIDKIHVDVDQILKRLTNVEININNLYTLFTEVNTNVLEYTGHVLAFRVRIETIEDKIREINTKNNKVRS